MKIDQVSDSVHVVAGTNVNWALISDDSGITVIDAGYPADAADVLGSVRQIGGRLADVRAVLITHAHLDHIGAIPALIEQFGMPARTHRAADRHRHRRRRPAGVAPRRSLARRRPPRSVAVR
ncbi:MBL fold metallo-hydrolase [Nocardia sp. NPDC060220]|uniref:MBL fold metallo-hydrolase n=1 Tax=Nocardia sp. NPDC060220 TaxID=3347076 RepID=UPI003653378F